MASEGASNSTSRIEEITRAFTHLGAIRPQMSGYWQQLDPIMKICCFRSSERRILSILTIKMGSSTVVVRSQLTLIVLFEGLATQVLTSDPQARVAPAECRLVTSGSD